MNELRDVAAVREAVAAGRRLSYLYFWGHRAPQDGRVGKWCLSQWWPARFEVGGITYPTAEHFMMAEKARLFGDDAALAVVLASPDPAKVKSAGRTVRGFDEDAWRKHRSAAVERGNRAKFGQNPRLGAWLASLSDDVLVEASPTDAVWGIGLAEADPRTRHPAEWPGLNLLGFALMSVRDELRAGDAKVRDQG